MQALPNIQMTCPDSSAGTDSLVCVIWAELILLCEPEGLMPALLGYETIQFRLWVMLSDLNQHPAPHDCGLLHLPLALAQGPGHLKEGREQIQLARAPINSFACHQPAACSNRQTDMDRQTDRMILLLTCKDNIMQQCCCTQQETA